jgi:predicted nucleic acid-binding protein
MSDKVFLDTNIFVYASNRSDRTKARQAERLIVDVIAARSGVVSYQVVQEFINLALRRFTKPMTALEAERYVTNVFQPLLSVHSSQGLFLQALHVQERHRLSWYDALIVAAAMEAGCAILYSEDLQHGQRFGSTMVKNPFR